MKKIFLFLLVPLFFVACSSSRMGEADKAQRLALNENVETVYDKAVSAAAKMKWEIKESSTNPYSFMAKTPFETDRWSDNVSVAFAEAGDSTIVLVNSKLGQKSNLDHITEYLKTLEGN